MQISTFVSLDGSAILEDISKEFLSQELCQNPKIISEKASLNRFQVKDTYCRNSLPGLGCCTFPRTIYIIHCLRPKSRDLYKEQADRRRENRWHFISCRESERECVCMQDGESMEYSMSSVSCSLENTFGAEVII